jgi:hypothetical protein
MNMGKFSELFERLKITGWTKIKKIVFLAAAIISILLFVIIVSNKQANKKPSFSKVNLIPNQTKSKPELNYEFIKFDTIKIPNFAPVEKPMVEPPRKIEPVLFTENTDQPKKITGTVKKPVNSKSAKIEPILPEKPISFEPRGNQSPNMIVTNNLAQNQVQSGSGSSTPTFTGMQTALLKVVLTNRTPVANGSLVEARILRDAKWGNVFIPKRTKLIGVAALFNRRVNIDFREILINDVSRSCRGRAYDLKRLQGLTYSPVNSEARRVLLEELRDAVSGVPVLGRVANRATYSSNYYDQDVSVLDEGLEFYVMIESIY